MTHRPRRQRVTALLVTWLLALPGASAPAAPAGPPQGAPAAAPITRAATGLSPVDEALQRLIRSAVAREAVPTLGRVEESARVERTSEGWVRAIGAPPGQAFAAGSSSSDPGALGAAFLERHRTAFGVDRPGTTFQADRRSSGAGRRFVRLRQRWSGVPVFGAAVVVQVDAAGRVEFVLADLARDNAAFHTEGFSTRPEVDAEVARAAALAVPKPRLASTSPEASAPELVLYEPEVIGNKGPSRLVWHVRVRAQGEPLDEVVLVDARTGDVAFHFSQVTDARQRSIYDNGVYPRTLARAEGQAATGVADVDKAYDYLGDVYGFFSTRFGRDSLDGAGYPLVAEVRYCAMPLCPWPNAQWDGEKMWFGEGYGTDDVVAHEAVHGITQYESNLIYWRESGALNESISDVLGELVDLTNGRGNDAAGVRWLVGEELPGGAIRNMADPPAFEQPDRRWRPGWYDGDSDNGGVHINSGVGNKLAYLLTDGGSFNGQTVKGVGTSMAAALFYHAEANLLAPASDYYDLYSALRQAAVNLGWSAEAREAVDRSSQATEISYPGNVVTLVADDFEGAFPGPWTVTDWTGVGVQWGPSTANVMSGSKSLWCAGGGPNRPPAGAYVPNMHTTMIYGPHSFVDASMAWLEFDMWVETEPYYDDFHVGVQRFAEEGFNGEWYSPGEGRWVHQVTSLWYGLDWSTVKIGFSFSSDAYVELAGVYVDNVVIKKALKAAPFGSFDTPAHGATGVVGAIPVTGWALDDVGVTKVDIWRDPRPGEPVGANGKVYIGDATFVPGARPDVESAFASYPYKYRAGWGYMLLTNMLPSSGNGTFTLYAYAYDDDGRTTLLGSKTITCTNSSATRPFGTIDTPAQGATVSGAAYAVFGWALTPGAASIPTNGSTIWVYVDGTPLGHPVYNLYRSDIATLFPGYANTNGAVGLYSLDTTKLTNGIHNIAWSVTDSLGRTEGIGSRYFWVQN